MSYILDYFPLDYVDATNIPVVLAHNQQIMGPQITLYLGPYPRITWMALPEGFALSSTAPRVRRHMKPSI